MVPTRAVPGLFKLTLLHIYAESLIFDIFSKLTKNHEAIRKQFLGTQKIDHLSTSVDLNKVSYLEQKLLLN